MDVDDDDTTIISPVSSEVAQRKHRRRKEEEDSCLAGLVMQSTTRLNIVQAADYSDSIDSTWWFAAN